MINRLAIVILAALLAGPSAGCRTGIRRVTSAIEGQGVSSVSWSQKPEEKSFDYLTSENTAFDAQGVDVTVDPATGAFIVRLDSISMIRTPSENQDTFAKQLREGRSADTEALGAYANITGAAVGAAVDAIVKGLVPISTVRQEQKTARRGIAAERDVDLARIGAEAAAEEAPPE